MDLAETQLRTYAGPAHATELPVTIFLRRWIERRTPLHGGIPFSPSQPGAGEDLADTTI